MNSTPFGRNSQTRDIARDSMGLIWVATDDSRIPVRCCDSSGSTLEEISSSIISSAAGVTIDYEGHLWVSNNDDMILYRIDVTE
jgi:ligand-binding sensor domain-containing protein